MELLNTTTRGVNSGLGCMTLSIWESMILHTTHFLYSPSEAPCYCWRQHWASWVSSWLAVLVFSCVLAWVWIVVPFRWACREPLSLQFRNGRCNIEWQLVKWIHLAVGRRKEALPMSVGLWVHETGISEWCVGSMGHPLSLILSQGRMGRGQNGPNSFKGVQNFLVSECSELQECNWTLSWW